MADGVWPDTVCQTGRSEQYLLESRLPQLGAEQRRPLEKPFELEELKEALAGMTRDQMLGADGFLVELY
ncbi:hypothetical protein NDU88_007649 [Pleurodeles waltl]|uniref:Uncharacterized protein n=1 Tax=Pleurodeles waltl TaxID=8319 RepID=A0AAV7VQC2_PLEWA|nr:hypothetical protein NDU88_007649 [Pleurodeles waltl]